MLNANCVLCYGGAKKGHQKPSSQNCKGRSVLFWVLGGGSFSGWHLPCRAHWAVPICLFFFRKKNTCINGKLTFSELSKTTAHSLWEFIGTVICISNSWAQNLSIHFEPEPAILSLIHQQISAEVVQTISTRGTMNIPVLGSYLKETGWRYKTKTSRFSSPRFPPNSQTTNLKHIWFSKTCVNPNQHSVRTK